MTTPAAVNQSAATVLTNESATLTLDDAGRIVGLRNNETGTELLTAGLEPQNWRLVVLTDAYPVAQIVGAEQQPDTVERSDDAVVLGYESVTAAGTSYPIRVRYRLSLVGDELSATIEVENRHTHRVRETWPLHLHGHQGYSDGDRDRIVDIVTSNHHALDVLNTGLPAQPYIFNFDVLREVGLFIYPRTVKMPWVDLSGPEEGLTLFSADTRLTTTFFRIEKAPPESGFEAAECQLYPPDEPRYLNLIIAWLTSIDPGETWTSEPAIARIHRGDWHHAADRYRAFADDHFTWPQRPGWMADYVGWQHLLGKTDLDEIKHTFAQYREIMADAAPLTGVNVLMTYGHENGGCESADFDIQPADDLGGPDGFAELTAAVHQQGGRVMIMTHRHQSIARDRSEYQRFAPWLIVDRDGFPRTEIWPKTTLESFMPAMLRTYEATGPIWSRVCVFSDEWWETYLQQLLTLIDLGLDGVQMDLLVDEPVICYGADHGHKPGAPEQQLQKLGERLAWLSREVRAVAPDFAFCGEEFADWMFQYLDISFSRYRSDVAVEVFGYTLPTLLEQVAVNTWAFDQVNKSIMVGKGIGIDVFIIKKSILEIPEFGAYIGSVVALRRKLREWLMGGTFQHHTGAEVTGEVTFGVHRGDGDGDGVAVVVRNSSGTEQSCVITREGAGHAVVHDLDGAAHPVDLPATIRIAAHRVAVVVTDN